MPAHSAFLRFLIALCAIGLLAAACGGDTEDASGVATLETEGAASDATGASSDADQTDEEALLAFSQCMRDEGVAEFPDPIVGADGSVGFGFGPGENGEPPFDRRSDEFQGAQTACEDLLGDATLGGGRFGGGDQTEVTDAFVAYSECLRGEGLDVGDFVPGQGVGPGGDGQGPPAGGPDQGDRGGRIAQGMGLDPDDPDVQDALAVCDPVLEDAFSGFGPGASNDNEA